MLILFIKSFVHLFLSDGAPLTMINNEITVLQNLIEIIEEMFPIMFQYYIIYICSTLSHTTILCCRRKRVKHVSVSS